MGLPGKIGQRPPSPPHTSGIGAQVRRPRPTPVATENPLTVMSRPDERKMQQNINDATSNANDLMTSLWTGLSFFSEDSSTSAASGTDTAPMTILSPKPGDGAAVDRDRVVSPSPSSASEHPGLEDADDEDVPYPPSVEKGGPRREAKRASSGKMRCTLCGVKVKAGETAAHECNFDAMYTRCTHCGEKVPLLEAGNHLCNEAVTGRPTEPLTPSTPGLQLAGNNHSGDPTNPSPDPNSSWVPMDALSDSFLSAGSSLLGLGSTDPSKSSSSSSSPPPASGAPVSGDAQADKAAAAMAVALSGKVGTDNSGLSGGGGGLVVDGPRHPSAEQRQRSWSLALGYELDGVSSGAAKDVPADAQPVPFETSLFVGEFYMALKHDKTLDSAAYREFFHGKSRTCQVQWRVRLKRPLKGGLFLGFESNSAFQNGPLPRSSVQSGLVSVLHFFHSKKDMHLHLPGMSSWSSSSASPSPSSSLSRGSSAGSSSSSNQRPGNAINEQGDWGLGVVGRKALCCFVETPEGEEPPPLNRPLPDGARVPALDLVPGPWYSFAWYTQYVEFSNLSLVNLPMMGSYPLPLSALRMVLYEAGVADTETEGSGSTPRRSLRSSLSLSSLSYSPSLSSPRAASATPPRPTSLSVSAANNTTPQAHRGSGGKSSSVSRAASATPPRSSLFSRSFSNSVSSHTPLRPTAEDGDMSPGLPPPPLAVSTAGAEDGEEAALFGTPPTFEHSPAAGAAAAAAANFVLKVGCVAAVGKKAKVRAECDKASALVGDVPSGRKVLVLALGTAADGTLRTKIRGPGILAASMEEAPSPLQGKGGSGGFVGKRRKELVELEGWVSASLLVDPAAVLQLSNASSQPNKGERGDPSMPEGLEGIGSKSEMGAGCIDGRTYGFSCVFARNPVEGN